MELSAEPELTIALELELCPELEELDSRQQ
jgi:hypothetical protein